MLFIEFKKLILITSYDNDLAFFPTSIGKIQSISSEYSDHQKYLSKKFLLYLEKDVDLATKKLKK